MFRMPNSQALLIVIALVIIWAEGRTRGRAAYHSSRPARRLAGELLPRVRDAGFDFASILSHRMPLDEGV